MLGNLSQLCNPRFAPFYYPNGYFAIQFGKLATIFFLTLSIDSEESQFCATKEVKCAVSTERLAVEAVALRFSKLIHCGSLSKHILDTNVKCMAN